MNNVEFGKKSRDLMITRFLGRKEKNVGIDDE